MNKDTTEAESILSKDRLNDFLKEERFKTILKEKDIVNDILSLGKTIDKNYKDVWESNLFDVGNAYYELYIDNVHKKLEVTFDRNKTLTKISDEITAAVKYFENKAYPTKIPISDIGINPSIEDIEELTLRDSIMIYYDSDTCSAYELFKFVNELLNVFISPKILIALEKILQSPKESEQILLKEKVTLKWLKDSVLLAYLINQLKDLGYLDNKKIWKKSEEIFLDQNGNHISSTDYTTIVNNYQKNKNNDSTKKGVPKDHEEISTLLSILIKVEKETKK